MNKWFQVLISLSVIASSSVTLSPAFAQIDSNREITLETDTLEERALDFSCQINQGTPTTVIQTPDATIPIIFWTSRAIALETTPAGDCEASIDRFQTAYDDGLFNYITTGRMNGQLVVCTADTLNGVCASRLLDLRITPKPRLALQSVLQISLPTEGPISDTDCRAYVSLDRYLQGDYDGQESVCPSKRPRPTPRE